ncbi:MAG: methyltransferase domain-containing protein [Trichodesmium sp. St11_bin5]|nr:methyltransferase domain-containing protein [Trichodesmium sp. St11_bin5]
MTSTLIEKIQKFYDASSSLWEQAWGEHMHHGYYGPDGKQKKTRRQAQIDMIEELLHWGSENQASSLWPPTSILDVGCGIGGSTLYLAEKFNATATGITLSPVQAKRAEERAESANLSQQTNFIVADALDMPFTDQSYDLVWSLESGEHMPNKKKFLQECHRVLKPGGRIIMATWCHRTLDGYLGQLTDDERRHLADIYRVYALPYVISLSEYEAITENISFQNISIADWSTAVAPFWDVVIESAFDPKVIVSLLFSNWTTIQAAISLELMSRGYERGLIKFGLLRGNKQLINT